MRKIGLLVTALTLIFLVFPVFAAGVGTIRLEPHGSYYPSPIMLSSPATFNVSVQPSGDPTCIPYLLLVMTNDSYYGLTGDVTVNWTNPGPDLTITSWTEEKVNGNKIPSGVPIHSGTLYPVSVLKSHLDTSDSIWWSFNPILDGTPLTQEKQDFTIILPSSDPRMLVYVLGKHGEYDNGNIICPGLESEFNNRVPPTMAGFVVPELGTLLLVGASFAGLVLYFAFRKKR